MTQYRVLFDDPDHLDEPTKVLVPTEGWMKMAMEGGLPPIEIYWALKEDEEQAIAEGRLEQFEHDPKKLARQHTCPRIGPLTEEQAIGYLCLKDLPRKCWAEEHNRPMFKIVKVDQIPSDRTFRDAWEMT